MFCASIRAVWDFSVNLFRSIIGSSWSSLRDVRHRGNRHFQTRHGFFGARHFAANNLIESRAVNGFVPEQLGGDLLVLIAVQVQNLLRLDVATVGGCEEDNAVIGLEAVHFDKQGVERLLALLIVIDHAHVHAALTANGVQLVNENDARACCLACWKRSRTRAAPTPTNISTKSLPL